MHRLSAQWRDALSLGHRGAPELYEFADQVKAGPHADTIRFGLQEVGLAAILCFDQVPTIAFLAEEHDEPALIDKVHSILWNQGILSLLLVLSEEKLTAYSLVRQPIDSDGMTDSFDSRLIETLRLTSDALTIKELIKGAESGRYWIENDAFFDPADRIDRVLLDNLIAAYRELAPSLGAEAAQALLMQSMFIAYLEDREIVVSADFVNASNGKCRNFADVLEAASTAYFEKLFHWLRSAFNGDIFNAPCAFDLDTPSAPDVSIEHLRILARFRHGREEMTSGQFRFFGYNFKYIPVALISAVYDRFLKEEALKKNADGAFYTPMFLADVATSQLWDVLSEDQKNSGLFCDPACGSGIFLVRLFQRLVAERRFELGWEFISWDDLTSIAKRLHGSDINPTAVRVAAFSLYLALLEHSDPRELRKLIEQGRMLPSLYRTTLLPAQDFFHWDAPQPIDVFVGNPPWKGRRGTVTTAEKWCGERNYPAPANDIAWGFIWKALEGVAEGGIIGFLLPSMGVLHNTSSHQARQMLFAKAKVAKIVNFSDLCFQLFDGADRPTCLLVFGPIRGAEDQKPYRFDYWVPKADLNLRIKRVLSLRRKDRLKLRSDAVIADPALLKRRMWTRAPEERLLQYLKSLPRLNELVVESRYAGARTTDDQRRWVIGQGFQPALRDRVDLGRYEPKPLSEILELPFLEASGLTGLIVPLQDGRAQHPNWLPGQARRRGFLEGYRGPHVMIPQGIERSVGRLRAAYSDQDFVFRHSLQAIALPKEDRHEAKLLTGILNSRIAGWFYFHETANLGADRAKIHQTELLKLPFAAPEKMQDLTRAQDAADQIVAVVEKAIDAGLAVQSDDDVYATLDRLSFEYYGLDESDISIINDTFEFIIPAMQPRRNEGVQHLWGPSSATERDDYAAALTAALSDWFDAEITGSVIAASSNLSIVKLHLGQGSSSRAKSGEQSAVGPNSVEQILDRLMERLDTGLPGNIYMVPDLRVVIDNELYLIKPIERREWLISTALADAEDMVAEFHVALSGEAISEPVHVDG